jgi:hypothetical protein
MRLLNTSTLCVCDYIRVYSTLMMFRFCGDHMVGEFLLRIMLQLLSIALPLELGAFQRITVEGEWRQHNISKGMVSDGLGFPLKWRMAQTCVAHVCFY